MLTVNCQACGANFLVPEASAGQEVKCGSCGSAIHIQTLEELAAARQAAIAENAWEYFLLSDRGRMGHVDQAKLNELGQQGWELLSVYREHPDGHTNYYFKRPFRRDAVS